MRVILFVFISIFLFNCNANIDRNLVDRSVYDLMDEFSEDWYNAHKYYKGKNIKFSGIPTFFYRTSLMFDLTLDDNENCKNDSEVIKIIECEFENRISSYNINFLEPVTILGVLEDSYYYSDFQSILFVNCVFIEKVELTESELEMIREQNNEY